MKIQIVSVRFNPDRNWWEITKLIDEAQFGFHTVPADAFVGWALQTGIEDAELLLDAVLLAPFLTEGTLEELHHVKAAMAPETKLHTAEVTELAKGVGLPEAFHPTEEDPLAPLREAAQKGIEHAQALQQVLDGTAGGPGGSSPGSERGEQRRDDQPAGVADDPRPVPARNRRRVVARKQTHHRRPGGPDQQEPGREPGEG